MRKEIIKCLTIAMASVVLATSVTTPITTTTTVEAASKVITIEEAAKKIVDTTNKAVKQKKKLTVTFSLKCSYSNSGKVESKIKDAVEKRLAGGYKESYLAQYLAIRFCGYEEYCHFSSNWKNGRLVCKYTVKGKNKKLSDYLFYLECGKQNLNELKYFL